MMAVGLQTVPVSQQALFRGANVRSRHGAARARGVAVVRAAAALPKGVTVPKKQPISPPPKFGWVDNAEVLNSRAAMLGFFGILIIEAITNKAVLGMLGLTVGQGLPFEL